MLLDGQATFTMPNGLEFVMSAEQVDYSRAMEQEVVAQLALAGHDWDDLQPKFKGLLNIVKEYFDDAKTYEEGAILNDEFTKHQFFKFEEHYTISDLAAIDSKGLYYNLMNKGITFENIKNLFTEFAK